MLADDDENGNPISLDDVTVSWTNGRQLSSFNVKDDNDNEISFLSYTYDDKGIRVSKTYGDTTTYYTNIDGNVTAQYQLDADGSIINLAEFIYNSGNEVIGFTYDNQTYFYTKNLQGDVLGIIDANGNQLVNYYYYTWGMQGCTDNSTNNLADINPFGYRSYMQETEMPMCYLQSRYYLTAFARFLNSDLPEYAQVQKEYYAGLNLFAYCCNDTVNNVDPTGLARISVKSAFKNVLSVIRNLSRKIKNGIKRYAKELRRQVVPIRRRKNKILLSSTAVAVAVDMLVYYMNPGMKPISIGLKGTLKFMPKPTAVKIFKYSVGDKMTYSIFTPLFKLFENIIKIVVGFTVDTVAGSLKTAIWAIENLTISKLFSMAVACTSIGGIVSSFLDAMDSNIDGFITIPRY